MRRRHGAVLTAVALCLGGALTACGSGDGDGYAAVGAAGSGPEEAPTAAVPPKGKVELVPLDPAAGGDPASGSEELPPGTPGGSTTTPGGQELPAVPGGAGTDGDTGGSTSPGGTGSSGGTSGGGTSGGGGATPAPGTTPPKPRPTPTPAGPAVLRLGEPLRAALDKRWCEQVTVEFRNTGGSAVASGTVTFATHIIGALGIDWATIESTQPLPAPIAAGAVRKQPYTVCVDAWRVPLGMHIETQDVTAIWK
ncbi:hypothetical protein HRW14_09975 [Streptomyces lunaelactis]|uniref:hypothetical protein n=1 Tax=Streptomyces lunaelactis TaxID=1535768 RepID=UPI0015856E59|nr:hypothetical protein [Streptomyces lunaelactis]NUK24179.1 hypothetical protein [Streptomyces lunaelactis]NUK50606.1 hypothetical protein [Streptomyces lunaelactis]NUK64792.1 hypothetical protein [Streptomyces lunaelactis]